MSGVFKIFYNDIKGITSHFLVVALTIGILFVPSLYAGINIFASGDPYANTANIEIAVASKNNGIKRKDTSLINSADEVMENLKDDDSVGWRIVGSPKEAREGVRSGKYYAAVIFKDGFTEDVYDYKTALSKDKAPIIYYSNAKKNAIAEKITDSAVSKLVEKINQKCIK